MTNDVNVSDLKEKMAATEWSKSQKLLNYELIDKHIIEEDCKLSFKERKKHTKQYYYVDKWRHEHFTTFTSSS